MDEQIKTLTVTFLVSLLFITSSIFFMGDLLTALHKGETVSVNYLLYYIRFYLPFHSICFLWLGSLTNTVLKKAFKWQIWVIPCLTIIIYAVSKWRFILLDNSFEAYGFKWQWCALFQWTLLFIIQLFLYQHAKVEPLKSFVISYYGVYYASWLYELPWYISFDKWNVLFTFPFKELFVLTCFTIIVWKLGLKLNRLLIFACVPLVLMWPFYFTLTVLKFYWVLRLTTFPFFILIPFLLKRKG